MVPLQDAKKDTRHITESIDEAIENSLKSWTDFIRVKYLIPFCRKWKLSFKAGNGTFVFFSDKGTIHLSEAIMYHRDHDNVKPEDFPLDQYRDRTFSKELETIMSLVHAGENPNRFIAVHQWIDDVEL